MRFLHAKARFHSLWNFANCDYFIVWIRILIWSCKIKRVCFYGWPAAVILYDTKLGTRDKSSVGDESRHDSHRPPHSFPALSSLLSSLSSSHTLPHTLPFCFLSAAWSHWLLWIFFCISYLIISHPHLLRSIFNAFFKYNLLQSLWYSLRGHVFQRNLLKCNMLKCDFHHLESWPSSFVSSCVSLPLVWSYIRFYMVVFYVMH